jgi:hypothetical protein
MSVKNSELADLIETTLEDLPKQEFEVQWDNEDYEFCRVYNKESMQIDGGESITRKVMLDNTGNATYRRNYDTDQPLVGNVMHSINVGWCQIGTNYSWDKFEIMRNKNSAKGFINLMKVRRIDGLWSLANLIEERAWLTPTNANDDLYPNGVPYYINMLNAGVTTGGMSGQTIRYQDGSTGTVCSGIDSAVEAKWRNWADVYSSIDNSFLTKFRKAFIKTQFKAPLFVNDPSRVRSAQKRIYTNSDNVVELMALADAKDDNHRGKDVLGSLRVDDAGLVYINRLMVQYIPQLEDADYDPVYCVDFRYFVPFIHAGYWMEESEAMNDKGQHTVYTVFLDGAHNNLCLNKRRVGFVLHTAIPA